MRCEKKYKCDFWSLNKQWSKKIEQVSWIRAYKSRSISFKEKTPKKLYGSRSMQESRKQTALSTPETWLQHALLTWLMNWQGALQCLWNLQEIFGRNNQVFGSDLDKWKTDQALRLCDQGRNCTKKQIQQSNHSKIKGVDRIWDPIKEKELCLPQWSHQPLSGVLILLGESNLPKSSSSRLRIDEGANFQSFLLDLTNKTMI